jgi:hypothetical protein
MTGPPTAPAVPTRVDYDGRRFRSIDAQPGGTAAEKPVGHYHQAGDLVWAEFSGAAVRAGRLVGSCRPDGVIDAAYCMLTTGGETVAGACESTPTLLPDGRVRLTERWRRLDGSSGVSHIEEIAE